MTFSWASPRVGLGKKGLTFVRFPLLPEFASGLDSCFAPVLAEILVGHDFTADELVLEVRAKEQVVSGE